MDKVVSKVKGIVKGVSTYFKCTYSSDEGRITIDFNRRDEYIAREEKIKLAIALTAEIDEIEAITNANVRHERLMQLKPKADLMLSG